MFSASPSAPECRRPQVLAVVRIMMVRDKLNLLVRLCVSLRLVVRQTTATYDPAPFVHSFVLFSTPSPGKLCTFEFLPFSVEKCAKVAPVYKALRLYTWECNEFESRSIIA